MGTNFRLSVKMCVPSRVEVAAAVLATVTRELVHDAGSKLCQFLSSDIKSQLWLLLLHLGHTRQCFVLAQGAGEDQPREQWGVLFGSSASNMMNNICKKKTL